MRQPKRCAAIWSKSGNNRQFHIRAVIVGGLVPTLLYQNVKPAWDYGGHAGTHDMDVALDLVILEKERYEAVAELAANRVHT